MSKWNTLATDESIAKTIQSLKENGITSIVVENKSEAKEKILELVPEGVEVFTTTSMTLEAIGIPEIINESGKYDSVRNKLNAMNGETEGVAMKKLGSAPEWILGSVHAVTEDGHVLIASNTGSQLGAYVYGSTHVIWVIGAQKIVATMDDAQKRLFEHTLPLESERVKVAYGMPHSNVSKTLVINKEVNPERITLVIVKEVLGY